MLYKFSNKLIILKKIQSKFIINVIWNKL